MPQSCCLIEFRLNRQRNLKRVRVGVAALPDLTAGQLAALASRYDWILNMKSSLSLHVYKYVMRRCLAHLSLSLWVCVCVCNCALCSHAVATYISISIARQWRGRSRRSDLIKRFEKNRLNSEIHWLRFALCLADYPSGTAMRSAGKGSESPLPPFLLPCFIQWSRFGYCISRGVAANSFIL